MILHWAKLKRNLHGILGFDDNRLLTLGQQNTKTLYVWWWAALCRSRWSFHFGTVWFHTRAPQRLFYWPQDNWKPKVFPSYHLSSPWWELSCHFAFPDGMMPRRPLGTAERARAWTQGRGKPVDKMWKGLINMWEILRCQNTAAELSCWRSVAWGVLSLPAGTREGGGTSGRYVRVLHGATQPRPAASEQLSHCVSSRTTKASVSNTRPLPLVCCVTRASLNLSTCNFVLCG